MLKLKMDLELTLQLAQDENDIVELEDVQKTQEEAYNKLSKFFNKFEITIGDWEGNTGTEIGYTESIKFTLIAGEKQFYNIYEETEYLKSEIDDCEIDIEDVNFYNEDEILEEIKKQLLNEMSSIKIMESIVQNILNYDDEGKILNEKCSDKDNTYCYFLNFYGFDDFTLSIDWEVIEYEKEDKSLYERIIKVTNIESI